MATQDGLIGTRVSFARTKGGDGDRQLPFQREGRSLGVFTSGGDAPGMNAAVRAIVRMAIFYGMKVYAIYEGYQGMVDGKQNIKELQWSGVSNIIQKGGTVIGSARCKAFMEREGRLKAAENLVKRGINNLAVIGGDGSLTGANIFKEEWKGLVKELVEKGRLTEDEAKKCGYLNVVGMVGTIDNDMCGTDMTIGTDSALHRIIEALDCITSTAASHQRSFVLEVMGRHCGYLALMSGIAGGADWVLIPECPPRPGWEDAMCKKIATCRQKGKRLSVVIVSEGAVDLNNRPITSQYVKQVLEKQLHHDTRITVLGHVQRGGKPSAYDRIIACRMGAAAALLLALAPEEIPPKMIGVRGNQIMEVPLMDCVERTRAINRAMKECDFKLVLSLQGSNFQRNLDTLKKLQSSGMHDGSASLARPQHQYRFAVMTVGSPAAGMDTCAWAFVRLLVFHGHTVLGIHEGFEGLLEGSVQEMTWESVNGWESSGGASLGTNRTKPDSKTLPHIAAKLGEYRVQGLLVIGGFAAYESLILLEHNRPLYTAFRVPLLGIAATVSNNVPGVEYSIGCDTALNMISAACDVLKQSAHSSRKRVFVVETKGGFCGYLANMAGLAGGADAAYIFEDPSSIADIQKDVQYLIGKFKDGVERGLIVRNEFSSKHYDTDFITSLYAEEGKGMYVTRSNILGHLQQGENPSPYDRILGVKCAAHAVTFMTTQAEENLTAYQHVCAMSHDSACMMGTSGTTTPLQELVPMTDFEHRIPKQQWWMSLRPLLSVLAKHKEHIFLGEVDQ